MAVVYKTEIVFHKKPKVNEKGFSMACNGQLLSMSCPEGKMLTVTSAYYGRKAGDKQCACAGPKGRGTGSLNGRFCLFADDRKVMCGKRRGDPAQSEHDLQTLTPAATVKKARSQSCEFPRSKVAGNPKTPKPKTIQPH